MSIALTLAQTTLAAPKVPVALLDHLVAEWRGKDFTVEDLKNDKALMEFISSSEKKKRSKKTPSAPKKSPQERALEDPDASKCQARTWANGFGTQCIKVKSGEGCLCKMHQGKPQPWWRPTLVVIRRNEG